jgi:hypothetical protein
MYRISSDFHLLHIECILFCAFQFALEPLFLHYHFFFLTKLDNLTNLVQFL